MKKCSKCKVDKSLDDFYNCKSNKDGKQKRCKTCLDNFYSKEETSKRNKEALERLKGDPDRYNKRKSAAKNWHDENKDLVNKSKKKYRDNNKDKIKEIAKKYREQNKDKINQKARERRKKQENKIKAREYLNERRRELRKTDPLFRLTERIRGILNRSFNYKKPMKSAEILGCSFIEFKLYLESKFEPWMNWDNRGLYNGDFNYGWDLDHIIPISSAMNVDDIIRLNHYTNFQPLCSKINRDIKRNHII